MDKYINKAKSKVQEKVKPLLHNNSSSSPKQQQHHNHGPPPIPPKPITTQQGDRPSTIHPPTPLDVLRYRYQHGANLGSIYVLEKWLFPAMFPANCTGSSELEAAVANVAALGMDGAREKLERHWANAVTEEDLNWLVNVAKCNTIRLPIGHFTLGAPFCPPSTPFAPYAPLYTNAWRSVVHLIARLRARGIGTLLDLHALPGGANACDHSGTNSGCAEHWRSRDCRALSLACVEWLAEQLASDGELAAGVVGLQVVNEAEWGAEGLWGWCGGVVGCVRERVGVPVYVSDAWDLGRAVEWAAGANGVGVGGAHAGAPVVVDTHLYWAFAEKDKRKSPADVVGEVGGKLGAVGMWEGDVVGKGAVGVVVGEYSCVLSEESWGRMGGGKSREEWEREFGQALSRRFQEKAMGSHFWTFKMQWMPGGGWGFKACTQKGAIAAPWTLKLGVDDVRQRLEVAAAQREERFGTTFAQHCAYWDAKSPGKPFEHWRYEQGWKQGFDDAAAFFGMRANGGFGDVAALGEGGEGGGVGGDKIGSLDIWVRKRLIESGMGGPFVWEYEQGLRKGVGEFCELAGGL